MDSPLWICGQRDADTVPFPQQPLVQPPPPSLTPAPVVFALAFSQTARIHRPQCAEGEKRFLKQPFLCTLQRAFRRHTVFSEAFFFSCHEQRWSDVGGLLTPLPSPFHFLTLCVFPGLVGIFL